MDNEERENLKCNMMWSMMQDMIIADKWTSIYGFYLIQQFERCFPEFGERNPGWIDNLKNYCKQKEKYELEKHNLDVNSWTAKMGL